MAEKVAQNEGVGNFSNLGVGLGVMGGIAGSVGKAANDAFSSISDNSPQDEMSIFKQKIEKLMTMKNMGLISDEEFKELKQKIIESI